MSKPLCIYHHNCADGFGAAWVVWKAYKGEVDFFPGIYGQPPADCAGRDVLLVDFSYKRDVMERIIASAKSVTILDHHKTAQAEIQALIEDGKVDGIFDMNKSGAVLTWDWFFPHEEPPQLLKHIEDRDLWRFALPKTREIQANLFSYPYDFEQWNSLIEQMEDPAKLAEFAYAGEAIERKHFKDIDELLGVTRREMNIGGYVVWAANLPYTLASDACSAMCAMPRFDPRDPRDRFAPLDPPPFAATYYDGKDGRFFSLRSRGDFDVSEIAKKYGGGGHKNAAGFTKPIGWEGEQVEDNQDKGLISDGYHTFNELYEHRHTLYALVLHHNRDNAWRSKLHKDGSMFDGWFIAGLNTEHGQVTYHLPIRLWDFFEGIKTLENAPEWDGHTAEDVIHRLRRVINKKSAE